MQVVFKGSDRVVQPKRITQIGVNFRMVVRMALYVQGVAAFMRYAKRIAAPLGSDKYGLHCILAKNRFNDRKNLFQIFTKPYHFNPFFYYHGFAPPSPFGAGFKNGNSL